jgi:hypothetical protein
MMFDKLFLDHPRSVDETYFQHLLVATGFGAKMVCAGLACLVHALVPGLFVRTGSLAIAELHGRMVLNRRRRDDAKGQAPMAQHPLTMAFDPGL